MMQNSRWFCTIAGSGVVFGLLNYFQSGKKTVCNSWNADFVPTVKWDSNWDKRDPDSMVPPQKRSVENDNAYNEAKQKVTASASRHLLFVRHGQYNLEGKTDSNRFLTETGREQANYTGIRLKSLSCTFSRMVHSTMKRAIETASIIHDHLPDVPMESCDMLREGAPTPAEPATGKWRPESKQFYQDGARIEAAFRKYFHRADASQKGDSFELYICHANVIRYFVCRALQFPPEAWQRFTLYNCSITWVTIRPSGRVYVYSVGDSGHIPPKLLTTT